MPLIDIPTGRKITKVPYSSQFKAVKAKLSDGEFEAIIHGINELIDESIAKTGQEITTAGWLPGSDWKGTPFSPIYWKGTNQNYKQAAMFFGQAVWYAIMHRPERWASGRYEIDGRDIGSRTYFRID